MNLFPVKEGDGRILTTPCMAGVVRGDQAQIGDAGLGSPLTPQKNVLPASASPNLAAARGSVAFGQLTWHDTAFWVVVKTCENLCVRARAQVANELTKKESWICLLCEMNLKGNEEFV